MNNLNMMTMSGMKNLVRKKTGSVCHVCSVFHLSLPYWGVSCPFFRLLGAWAHAMNLQTRMGRRTKNLVVKNTGSACHFCPARLLSLPYWGIVYPLFRLLQGERGSVKMKQNSYLGTGFAGMVGVE